MNRIYANALMAARTELRSQRPNMAKTVDHILGRTAPLTQYVTILLKAVLSLPTKDDPRAHVQFEAAFPTDDKYQRTVGCIALDFRHTNERLTTNLQIDYDVTPHGIVTPADARLSEAISGLGPVVTRLDARSAADSLAKFGINP